MRKLACCIFYIILWSPVIAQNNKVDSLKSLLQNELTDTGKIRILLEMGNYYNSYRNPTDSTLNYLRQALYLSQKTRDTAGEIRSLINMSIIYYYFDSYPESLETAFQSLKLAQQLKDTNMLFSSNRQIMMIYSSMQDYNKVLEYASVIKALVHSGFYKDPDELTFHKLTGYINHFGIAYLGLKKYDSSLNYMRLAYQLSKKRNDAQGLGISLTNIGRVYARLNKIDSALAFYKEALQYSLQSNREDLWARVNISIAGLFHLKGKIDSTFFYVKTALEKSKNIQFSRGIMDADSLISELYAEMHRYDSAYVYQKQFIKIRENVFSNEKAVRAQYIGFNETLRKQRIEQEKKDAQQAFETKMKIYGLLAGLTFLSVLAFILYRSNRQKNKANVQIDKAFKELKSTQAQLIQSEKMASLGELTAGIAHEIQNPLNFVNNFSDVNKELVDELKSELATGNMQLANEIADDIKENEEKINHHGKRADAIVKGMLQHSRTSSGQKEPTDINALCDEYLRLAYHGLKAKDKTFNAKLETNFDTSIGRINIVPQDIGRVVLNLINNAFYAVTEKKNQNLQGYEPTVTVTTKRLNGKIEVTVKDDGTGIPQKVMDKIFQPFFTTKPTGQGTGLGLSLAYDIVKAHGGELKVETKEAEGSTFLIVLP